MAQSSKDKVDTTATPPSESTALLLFGTIGNTTWRMFVPTIGLALIGDFFDSMLSSRPWLMLVGTALGAAVAYWLIWHQLKKVQQ